MENAISALEVRLSATGAAPRKVNEIHILMIIALELAVMDPEAPLFRRFMAGVTLVKIFAALRFDDTRGVSPQSFIWLKRGLQFDIARSKVSGPGKKTKLLRGHVSFGASLSGRNWLLEWRGVIEADEFNFERDYLIPGVACGGAVIDRRPAEYADAVIYSAVLFHGLLRPQQDPSDGSWSPSEEHLLVDGLYRAFGQHSERNKLNRIAAAFGHEKSERNYLGRWHADGSDNYLATAMSAVFRIQEDCCRRLLIAPDSYDETESGSGLEIILAARA